MRAITDEQGRFRLPIDPGRETLVVAGSWEDPVGVDAELVRKPADSLRLQLQPAAKLVARLLYEDDRPAGCRAEVRVADPAASWLTTVLGGALKTRCGEDGDVELGPFRARDLSVRFHPERGLPLTERVSGPPPGDTIDLGVLRVLKGERIVVRVAEEAGGPVQGAEVVARGRSAIVLHATGETDRDGRVELSGLPPGSRIMLEVSAPGFLDARRSGLTVDDFPLDLALEPAARLTGHVVDPLAEPIAGAEVLLRQGEENRPASTTSGADGRFEIDVAPEGTVRLTAQAPGYRPSEELEVEVEAGERRTGLLFELEPAPELRGRVVDQAGDPVAGAEVALVDRWALGWLEEGAARASAITGERGRFSLPRMDTTHVVLLARADGHGAAVERAPFSHREPPLRLVLPEAAAARVYLPEGLPAGVVVKLLDGVGLGHVRRVESAAASEGSASVRFDGLTPGAARAQLVPGPSTAARLDAGTETEIWLEAGAVVDGRITHEGAPVSRAVVNAAPVEGQEVRFGQLRHSDRSGRFRFEGLEPGRYLIVAESDLGRGERRIALRAGEHRDLALDVERIALRLLVRDAETEAPLSGARARLAWGGFEGEPSLHGIVAFPRHDLGFDMVVNNFSGDDETTGSNGSAVLAVPREGEFVLTVRLEGYEPWNGTISLPRGESQREVRLDPVAAPRLRVHLEADPPGQSGVVLVYGSGMQRRIYTSREALFEDVPPGNYHVVFLVEGFGTAHETVTVGETGETAVSLSLSRGGTLVVPVAGPGSPRPKVVDSRGTDWTEIFRRVELPGQGLAGFEQRPEAGPSWIFPGLPPGSYTVRVGEQVRQPVPLEPGGEAIAW